VVEDTWGALPSNGWMSFVLKEKLKGLKVKIKEWHKGVYGDMEARIAKMVEDITILDIRGDEVGLSGEEVQGRKTLFRDLWTLLKAKDVNMVQRARARWMKNGDANTKYFHRCVKLRHSGNAIKALKVGDAWVQSPTEVRRVVVDFFSNHVAAPEWERPKLDGVVFEHLGDEENGLLVAPFSMEEIEGVLEECDGDKSPGPDGFNFAFIKKFWYLIKNEVRIMFDQFHGNENLPKPMLAYFVALIPKINSPLELKDYRPISLLGCLYKLLAKVLARRLARVMDPIISQNQLAFLKGRNLGDGVLVINEIVDFAKKSNFECLILKVDFEKAYDSVDWGFLMYMMERVGMGPKWRAWMKACVCGGSMSILVNGSPTEEINIHRGLKQGDPLAPFLFLLVAEGFSGLMRNAVRLNLFEGFKLKEEGKVYSHLQYADDTLCVGKATVGNLWTLKALLRGFEMASGLKVNFYKSCLMGINVSPEFMVTACNFLNCGQGSFPFKYLGLPVGGNPGRAITWEPLLDQFSKKLNSWGNRYLSLGGRIVLLNSVLNALPIFYLSFFTVPVCVAKKIVRIQREFLWGGVLSWFFGCQTLIKFEPF
jgi:hypothetical protein